MQNKYTLFFFFSLHKPVLLKKILLLRIEKFGQLIQLSSYSNNNSCRQKLIQKFQKSKQLHCSEAMLPIKSQYFQQIITENKKNEEITEVKVDRKKKKKQKNKLFIKIRKIISAQQRNNFCTICGCWVVKLENDQQTIQQQITQL